MKFMGHLHVPSKFSVLGRGGKKFPLTRRIAHLIPDKNFRCLALCRDSDVYTEGAEKVSLMSMHFAR